MSLSRPFPNSSGAASGGIATSALRSPPAFPRGSDIFPTAGPSNLDSLSGLQKAALLLYSLGTEVSVNVMKHLKREDARRLSAEIAKIKLPSSKLLLDLIREFSQRFQDRVDKIQDQDRRDEDERNSKMPFKSLRQLHPDEIASILADEQSQTIALVLSYLNPDQSADVLASFPQEAQSDLVERIATIEEIPNELVRRIEGIIEEKARPFFAPETAPADLDRRMETLSMMLQRANVSSDDLLSRIGEINPSMAKELRIKAFTFENIVDVDDQLLQKALMQVDPETIALALKIAEAALIDKILNCVPMEVREEIKDRRDLMGPKTLMEIEDAQREIIYATKRMME